MRLMSIASGSSGNCIYVGTEKANLLVDAGISGKRIGEGLKLLDVPGEKLDGVLITHEHSDHIQGLGVISRKYGMKIYATKGTLAAIQRSTAGSKIDPGLFVEISYDTPFTIKDVTIYPMKISHDAAQPTAYHFTSVNQKAAILTDLGYYDAYLVEQLKGVNAIFLESNHDVRMLQLGPYTYQLKQRVLGRRGHLSNEAAGRLLTEILHDDLRYVLLSHLSHENNLPELAYESVRLEITMGDNPYRGEDFNIQIAPRAAASVIVEL